MNISGLAPLHLISLQVAMSTFTHNGDICLKCSHKEKLINKIYALLKFLNTLQFECWQKKVIMRPI